MLVDHLESKFIWTLFDIWKAFYILNQFLYYFTDNTYYLDAEYHGANSQGTWAHHNAYISDTLPTSVTHWTTDPPLVYVLNITQDQGVPYNMTVKYANGTEFDLAANTWMTVDYSSLGIGNSTVTVTINTDSLGPYYNQTDNYELNFEVQTLDSTNNVTQNHLINITLENGKFKFTI